MNKESKIRIASAYGISKLDNIKNPILTDVIEEFFVEEVFNYKGDIIGFNEIVTGERIIDRPRSTLFFELLVRIDLDSRLPYQGIIFRQHKLPEVGDVWWEVSEPIIKDDKTLQELSNYLKQTPEEISQKLEQIYITAGENSNKIEYLKKSDVVKKLIKSKRNIK